MSRFARRIACAVLLACATPFAAHAADAPPASREQPADSWHYDLWSHLMSPYCPGRTLLDCTSSQAAELRGWIADQEKLGRSRAEVEAQLYQEFGDVILQAPKPQGFGLAAYVIPALAFLVGGAVVAIFLRRQTPSAPPPPSAVPPFDPDIERRIDEEMKRDAPRA